MRQDKPKPKRTVVLLKRQIKAAGIRQVDVANRAGVRLPHVCNVFAGRAVSKPVLDAARALLEERTRPVEQAIA